MVVVAAAGFPVQVLRDMDHVAFAALYQSVERHNTLEAASDLALGATAAQGDSKGIQKTMEELRRAGGVQPKTSNITDLIR